MKKSGKGSRFLLVAMVVILITLPASAIAQDSEEVSLLGMVTPDGLFVTEDGEEYVIDQDTEEGEDLLQIVGKKVVLNGIVSETEGTFIIMVDSYSEAE